MHRAAVPHVDDLGLCEGANRAFLELSRAGHVTCGSVMVPAPAFVALAETAARDPALDLGVHLTLTSEWAQPRWRPLSTRSAASGLIDADGYMHRDVASLAAALVPEAAEAELRAQIEAAIAAGLRPTHIDAHMAAAMLPALLDAHVRLAHEYRVVPVLPRRIGFAPDPAAYAATIAALGAAPLPDGLRGTLPIPEDALATGWDTLLAALPAGVTHLALHCTAPGEMAAIEARHAAWRTAEYRLFARGAVTALCDRHGVARLGYRAIQSLWFSAPPAGADPSPAR